MSRKIQDAGRAKSGHQIHQIEKSTQKTSVKTDTIDKQIKSQATTEETLRPSFNRKQLAWMGLLTGVLIIFLLNAEFDYRSIIDDTSRELFSYNNQGAGVWGINSTLLALTWFFRVHLGAMFAIVIGTVLNALSFVIKKI